MRKSIEIPDTYAMPNQDISIINAGFEEEPLVQTLAAPYSVAFVDTTRNPLDAGEVIIITNRTLNYPSELTSYYGSIDLAYDTVKNLSSPVICLVGNAGTDEDPTDPAIMIQGKYEGVIFIAGNRDNKSENFPVAGVNVTRQDNQSAVINRGVIFKNCELYFMILVNISESNISFPDEGLGTNTILHRSLTEGCTFVRSSLARPRFIFFGVGINRSALREFLCVLDKKFTGRLEVADKLYLSSLINQSPNVESFDQECVGSFTASTYVVILLLTTIAVKWSHPPGESSLGFVDLNYLINGSSGYEVAGVPQALDLAYFRGGPPIPCTASNSSTQSLVRQREGDCNVTPWSQSANLLSNYYISVQILIDDPEIEENSELRASPFFAALGLSIHSGEKILGIQNPHRDPGSSIQNPHRDPGSSIQNPHRAPGSLIQNPYRDPRSSIQNLQRGPRSSIQRSTASSHVIKSNGVRESYNFVFGMADEIRGFLSESQTLAVTMDNSILEFREAFEVDELAEVLFTDSEFIRATDTNTRRYDVPLLGDSIPGCCSPEAYVFTGDDGTSSSRSLGSRIGYEIITEDVLLNANTMQVIYVDASDQDVVITLPQKDRQGGKTQNLDGKRFTFKRIDTTSNQVWIKVEGSGRIDSHKCFRLKTGEKCLSGAMTVQYVEKRGQYYIIE